MGTFENSCCYCGKCLSITHPDFTKEHLIPKSKGGNNFLINKKPCCKNCNSWRGNQTFSQFKVNVAYCLNNNIFENGYTKYDYFVMIENIDYWKWIVETDLRKFKK